MVDGFVRLMDTDDTVTGPINLGNPVEFSIRELAERTLRLTGSRSPIEYRPLPQDDPRQRRPDITRAKGTIGWEPRIGLEEGLARTIEYFRTLLPLLQIA
jgi:UDP-glucuronate decarboxylase